MNKVAMENVRNDLYCKMNDYKNNKEQAIEEARCLSQIEMYEDMSNLYKWLLGKVEDLINEKL